MRERAGGFAGVMVLVAVSAAGVRADVTVRDSGTFVVDRAGIIEAAVRDRMEGWLRELERKTGAQLKVLTVSSTDGEDPFQFGVRHAELWKLGRKDRDNGALIVVSLDPRDVRIHTGYGLEGVLPDGWCGQALREIAVPLFKRGQYSQGVFNLTVATANRIADEAGVRLTGVPAYRHRGHRGVGVRGMACGGLLPILLMIAVFSSVSRRRRYYGGWGGGGLLQGMLLGSVLGNMMGGGRSHWGGGFGGGGFGGGFGGGSFGGGGGFGGGGAGASW